MASSQTTDWASTVIDRCRQLAQFSEEPGLTTRTFLSPPMRRVHQKVGRWMHDAGMSVRVDAAGNIRGVFGAEGSGARRLILGSHLDTVPNAGAFDGVLGVMLGMGVCEMLGGALPRLTIEVVGFSEEEGVRFGTPFLGSLALIGELTDELLARRDSWGLSVAEVIRDFGLDPAQIGKAQIGEDTLGYFEFHIEQGPVLDQLGLPLGIVEGIVGQDRFSLEFEGQANHAGTTPMRLRRDALAGAAEWVLEVEREALRHDGLTATVGKLEASPNAGNVIAGSVRASLDVRHRSDELRRKASANLIEHAGRIADRRGLKVAYEQKMDQATVPMDARLAGLLKEAVEHAGIPAHRMYSGAGHDAMILARRVPAALLFLRSPGGISHDPQEDVRVMDVAAALDAGKRFVESVGEACV